MEVPVFTASPAPPPTPLCRPRLVWNLVGCPPFPIHTQKNLILLVPFFGLWLNHLQNGRESGRPWETRKGARFRPVYAIHIQVRKAKERGKRRGEDKRNMGGEGVKKEFLKGIEEGGPGAESEWRETPEERGTGCAWWICCEHTSVLRLDACWTVFSQHSTALRMNHRRK